MQEIFVKEISNNYLCDAHHQYTDHKYDYNNQNHGVIWKDFVSLRLSVHVGGS